MLGVVKFAYATFTSPVTTAHIYNVTVALNLTVMFERAQKVSEYVQELQQSHTTDRTMAPRWIVKER